MLPLYSLALRDEGPFRRRQATRWSCAPRCGRRAVSARIRRTFSVTAEGTKGNIWPGWVRRVKRVAFRAGGRSDTSTFPRVGFPVDETRCG
ncbi:hypothetical protein BHM03_00040269 [Ensete ventricosum]|nr:hypothetical protein BHM03_00040269 [Ensete ventricosum]